VIRPASFTTWPAALSQDQRVFTCLDGASHASNPENVSRKMRREASMTPDECAPEFLSSESSTIEADASRRIIIFVPDLRVDRNHVTLSVDCTPKPPK